jgi:hypothetical protein
VTSEADPRDAFSFAVPAEVALSREDFARLVVAGMELDEETASALYPMITSLRSLALAVDRAMAASDGVAASEDAVPAI